MITKWIVESYWVRRESKETNSRIRESGSAREKKMSGKRTWEMETFGVYIIDVSK